MVYKFRLEACVENFQEAKVAVEQGAQQIEICSRLDLDGLTPSVEDVTLCLQHLGIPVKVMIRPRAGSFTTREDDINKMKLEIETFKEIGVEAIVLGLTTNDNQLDIPAIQNLVQIAQPMKVTIHKAIDTCSDILNETQRIADMSGIHSILTSGGQTTALLGAPTILKMMAIVADNVEIIPAGKITNLNIQSIDQQLKARTYHGRRIVGNLGLNKSS